MGIRYETLAEDPQTDPLRPKNIDNNIDDYLNCNQPNPEEFRDVYKEGNRVLIDYCCKNCCLYAIFNLTCTEFWQEDFLSCIKIFLHKKMHIIYIIKNYECEIAQKLYENKFNHNGSILTEENYGLLVHTSLGGKTLFENTKYIKEKYKPKSHSEKLHISAIHEMRKSMEEIIYFHLRLNEIEKFGEKKGVIRID